MHLVKIFGTGLVSVFVAWAVLNTDWAKKAIAEAATKDATISQTNPPLVVKLAMAAAAAAVVWAGIRFLKIGGAAA